MAPNCSRFGIIELDKLYSFQSSWQWTFLVQQQGPDSENYDDWYIYSNEWWIFFHAKCVSINKLFSLACIGMKGFDHDCFHESNFPCFTLNRKHFI